MLCLEETYSSNVNVFRRGENKIFSLNSGYSISLFTLAPILKLRMFFSFSALIVEPSNSEVPLMQFFRSMKIKQLKGL